MRWWPRPSGSQLRPSVSGALRIAAIRSPSVSIPMSRVNGRIRSVATVSSSAGPSSGSGTGNSESHCDWIIVRAMSKPAANPAKPSVRSRASVRTAATARSWVFSRSNPSDRSRALAQVGTALRQVASSPPSSARRSVRRASSRKSRMVDQVAAAVGSSRRLTPEGSSGEIVRA